MNMYIEQLYTNCLAQAAYYIESDGEAAIVDPLRDYEVYIAKAKERGARIRYIFETHFHADFVSGHIDLARESGASIVYGPTTTTSYPVHVAQDGEVFELGKIKIQLLHTPGHTPESSCMLVKDESGKDHCVFTGDTLFVGDVGRPDLLDGVMSKEDLAGMMYDSLHSKLMPLADEVIVYPAHGPGSACGKNIGKETHSTIGQQRRSNYALQPMLKAEFVKVLTDGIAPAPAYFFKDAQLNRQGYAPIQDVLDNGLTALTADEVVEMRKSGVVVIDTRNPEVFETGFIPGAINCGLNGQYAIWAATLLDITQPILIVAEPGKERESVERLTRVGFDQIRGFLQGGFPAWTAAGKRYDMAITIDEEEFELDAKHSDAQILDVRKTGEWNELHLQKATHFPLDAISANWQSLNPEQEYLVHCAGGYRSMIAVSFLKSKGLQRVKNVAGGFTKIKQMKLPMESTSAVSK